MMNYHEFIFGQHINPLEICKTNRQSINQRDVFGQTYFHKIYHILLNFHESGLLYSSQGYTCATIAPIKLMFWMI